MVGLEECGSFFGFLVLFWRVSLVEVWKFERLLG